MLRRVIRVSSCHSWPVSIGSVLREYATTIAAFAATASALAAWRSSNRAAASARESARGTAMTLRPGFTVVVDKSLREGATADVLVVRNVTPNLATDTSITLETEHRRLIGSAYDLRIPGAPPDDVEDIEGRPEVSFAIPHTVMEELGKEFTLLITIRFSDRYFLQHWEQRVTVSYHVGSFVGPWIAKYWTDPVGTEIRPYRKRLMPIRFPWQD